MTMLEAKTFKTIKPFSSTKQSHYSGSKIVLNENDSIISDVFKVADIFDMYHESIAVKIPIRWSW